MKNPHEITWSLAYRKQASGEGRILLEITSCLRKYGVLPSFSVRIPSVRFVFCTSLFKKET